MAQNIYDDPGFFSAYSGLERSTHGLGGAAEWPSLRALLPAMQGLRILDLGCGFGWFCRWAREQGAASVLGIDVSERMLERAARSTQDATITYRRADMETLELPAAAFDLAYSSLAFHYLAEPGRTVGHDAQGARPGWPSRLFRRASDLHRTNAPGLVGRCRRPQALACGRLSRRGSAHHRLVGRGGHQAAPDPRHLHQPVDPHGVPADARRRVGSERGAGARAARMGGRARAAAFSSRLGPSLTSPAHATVRVAASRLGFTTPLPRDSYAALVQGGEEE